MKKQEKKKPLLPHLLLVDHGTLWLCQDALKVSGSQATQLHTDGQPTLEKQQAKSAVSRCIAYTNHNCMLTDALQQPGT